MALTFTVGPTVAGVDEYVSGALNCARAEWVMLSAYKSAGGRVEGTPEELTRGFIQLILMTKIELEAV